MDDGDSPTTPPYERQQHASPGHPGDKSSDRGDPGWQVLAEFTLHDQMSSKYFTERTALAATGALTLLQLQDGCLPGLEVAVERAALNALEHRDRLHSQLPISICIYTSKVAGSPGAEELTGTSCGWGYFIIQKITEGRSGEAHPVVQLYLYPEGNT
jgi:hypothetical protein